MQKVILKTDFFHRTFTSLKSRFWKSKELSSKSGNVISFSFFILRAQRFTTLRKVYHYGWPFDFRGMTPWTSLIRLHSVLNLSKEVHFHILSILLEPVVKIGWNLKWGTFSQTLVMICFWRPKRPADWSFGLCSEFFSEISKRPVKGFEKKFKIFSIKNYHRFAFPVNCDILSWLTKWNM